MAFFFLCRARAGTNRTDPPLSVRNRWMGESGQACPASHYHFPNKSFFFFFSYLKGLIAETGTEGERHTPALMSAFECFLPAKSISPLLLGYFRASIRLQTIEEHAALAPPTPSSLPPPPVCIAVAAPPSVLWNKQARCFHFRVNFSIAGLRKK